MNNDPFTVEARNDGASFIIRPVGVCLSFFKSKADAEIMARSLNNAYRRGRSDLQAELRSLLNVSEQEITHD